MKVVFAGGGTGGHLLPGIALAETIAQKNPKAQLLFLCTNKEFDKGELTKSGFFWITIDSPSFKISLPFVFRFLAAKSDAYAALKRVLPDIIVGLGGYGSIPPILAGRKLGIPYVILEQNLLPGKANRFLAGDAKRIYAQWENSIKFFHKHKDKFTFSGSPLRSSIRYIENAKSALGFSPDKITLTIVGGSQGAEGLNKFMAGEAKSLTSLREKIQILHITGALWKERLQKIYDQASISAKVFDYTDRMAEIYSATDLILSRAGGLAIAEIAHYGLPAIFVPYPFAAENHQLLNAKEVADAGGAIVYEESNLKGGIIQEWLSNKSKLAEMGTKIKRFAKPDASEIIASEIFSII